MIVKAFLAWCKPRSMIFIPSTIISDPLSGSANLYIATVIEDFPAPVLPTIPMCSFGCSLKSIFFRTKSSSGLYLNWRFFTSIPELFLGQSAGSLKSGFTKSPSEGKF